MKKTLIALAAAAVASMAFAEPFVWPSAWSTEDPADANYGGTYRVYDVSDIKTFNPAVTDTQTQSFTGLWFDQAQLIMRGPDSDDWLPYAASSFEVSEDGLSVSVTLRDNLKWSDGETLDANDYYLTYLVETDEDTGSNGYDSWFIDGNPITVDLVDDLNLVYNFPVPDREAMPVVATSPLPDHILGEVFREGGGGAVAEEWGNSVDVSELVGAGPFVPTVHQPGERLVMSRNEHFGDWNVDEAGNGLPYLDALSFTFVTDTDAALNLYLAGELDSFGPRNFDDIGLIANAINNGEIDADIVENISPVASSAFIVFNWNLESDPKKQELFRNADFRRAMSHLTDRDAMIDLIYQGAAEPMYYSVYQVYDYWVND
ncbi:MAG TPA: ABC transporter substrate-binding protein, partial [Deinococcales bacterium]|nr:ABC transporter substrate-binding protein [Deinococcales bacterium]